MNSQLIITVLSIVISTVATSFVVINFLLARIDKLDDKLSKRIDQVDDKLSKRVDQVEQKLEAKIDQVEQKLEAKISQVEQKLEAKIDNLQESFANVRIEIAKLEVYIFGGAKSFKPSANQISELES